MKKVLVYLIALMVLPIVARAGSLDEAHAAFAAGKFHDSSTGYQSVLDADGYSEPVLFDLGNSLVREGDYPKAILAYKRALWLAPDDADVLANLQTAQKQAGATVEQTPVYAKFTNILSVSGWAWAGCLAWTLLCACVFLRKFVPERRTLFSFGGGVCVLVLAGAITAIMLGSGGLREAVVIDKNAQVLMSPFPAAQAVVTPVPGETVKLGKAYNDFLRVSDNAGHTGWMAKSQLEPVVK